ncbi:hypothetical protein [Thalassotalea sp. ND16A]|uniref:hypothetical protein n=1 Tax=Thalassotalea sp. ND16A TaxID=1535422 RepID=UPI00051A4D82|nr:hypothetical protein [Thalassotalea sp. ND16A]KGJ89298.1 hypothetical protein ND16A_2191 [Thalassotalea sp. ND16A]
MNFLKKLFAKDSNDSNKARQLNQPQDLLSNDIIVLSDNFALPEILRQQQFQVSNINSHEFEHALITEWALTGKSNETVYLSVERGAQPFLKFSYRIEEQDVASLFNLDDFAQIFSEDADALLTRQQDSPRTSGWTCEQYQQTVAAQMGYFHRKDCRAIAPSEFEGEDAGEVFELYSLRGNDDQYAIDIQIWQDGDTDVFVNIYRPVSDIKEYYPGS